MLQNSAFLFKINIIIWSTNQSFITTFLPLFVAIFRKKIGRIFTSIGAKSRNIVFNKTFPKETKAIHIPKIIIQKGLSL
ncbi:hypothetical protein DOS84_05255 [Flavobacterium aquariorum]|uniref:Uncharacterized protein n=1 Tax=Flavobacterium aquariorum TaxID=2217670 RepID=A0A2W7UIE1_9FLAO|nr:hypothetical protein DOS84_05255 [Flavobacterium aquariorum]